MEFVEDHGFGKAWLLYNGHYLITFSDSSVEEFETKRDYQAYVRRMKKMMGGVYESPPPPKRLRRLNDKKV